jgi:hypothetical protein
LTRHEIEAVPQVTWSISRRSSCQATISASSATDSAGSESGSVLTASPTMNSSPHSRRIRVRISAENRIRFSKLPPEASVRRFDGGTRG